MTITGYIVTYLISIPLFFLIDMLWLGVIARDFYQGRLAHLLGDVNWPAAILFYLIFLVGLTYFAIAPSIVKASLSSALMLGALFGFFTYATYDMTNLATIKNWPVSVVLVDMAWGTILGSTVSAGTYMIYAKLFL